MGSISSITTRSGLQIPDSQPEAKEVLSEKPAEKTLEKEPPYIPYPPYKPALPLPQSWARTQIDQQFEKFLELLSKLHINVQSLGLRC